MFYIMNISVKQKDGNLGGGARTEFSFKGDCRGGEVAEGGSRGFFVFC